MSGQKIELPLAQGLSIEIAAHSVVGRFVTTHERVIVSRPFLQPARFYVEPQWPARRLLGK
jgi:hypothetical protein